MTETPDPKTADLDHTPEELLKPTADADHDGEELNGPEAFLKPTANE